MPIGKNVVIIGGGFQGCQLAEFLIKRGRKVTIVEASEMIGDGLVEYVKAQLLPWLAAKCTAIWTKGKYERITDSGLIITTKQGARRTIAADTIIPIMPLTPSTDLVTSLRGRVKEVHAMGSCREPGLIVDAIADGARVGQQDMRFDVMRG